MFHQRRSFYPFILALLTLLLAALMMKTLVKPSSPASSVSETVPVTEADYRQQSHDVIAPFVSAYQSAPTDIAKLVAVEDALSALTDLIVIPSFKEVHFNLAVSLSLIRDGLRSADTSLQTSGYTKLTNLISTYPWLMQ